MYTAILSIFGLVIATLSPAQNTIQDKSAINKQIDAMLYSWNHHDYSDLKNYTTESTDWVNGVGMWWKGRKESQYAHQVYHDGMFKESVVTKQSSDIRLITRDVAIAHINWHFTEFTGPDGKKLGPDDAIATIVYVRKNGQWQMESGQNTRIMPEAQQSDPVKHMPADAK